MNTTQKLIFTSKTKKMKINKVTAILDKLSPLAYAEDFDNTGLLVGNPEAELSGILVTLDTLEDVVDEAIAKNCNLIVSFHPIIFSGLKKITGKNYVERVVLKAIKNDIAIYSNHTALDNARYGVNDKICEVLGLQNKKILLPKKNTIKKLTTFVPINAIDTVRNALFAKGAGSIGNYDSCSFNIEGEGSFRGNEASNPTLGERGTLHFEKEIQLGVTYPMHLEKNILKALFEAHPYEEVAYEITTLDNVNQHIGMGMIGELEHTLSESDFLNHLKIKMHAKGIRHSKFINKKIKKVAVLGGSGSFAIDAAKAAEADAYVSADFKYHDFFKAEKEILLADIGHYESEQFTKELLYSFLTKKITNFAPALSEDKIMISEINTNPVSYY